MKSRKVVVFTEREGSEEYLALARPDVAVEAFSLEEGETATVSCDTVMAVIDCGVNADAGLWLLARIKRNRPDIPVIFVTAASSEEVVIKAYKAGARDYFRKPLDQWELEKTVDLLLRLKGRAADEHPPLKEEEPAVVEVKGLPIADCSPCLLRAIEYIEGHLSEAILLDTLARQACMSKFHFCRVFKRRIGMSPMHFLVLRRIEKAKELLCQADHTISMVAFKSGFNDLSDFNHQFKKFTGLTPTAFRKISHTEKAD